MMSRPWAVSAGKSWLTPLVVLVPILATLVGGFLALFVWPPLVLVVIAVGLAITALAGARPYGTRLSLGAAGLALGASFIAFWIYIAVSIGASSICNKAISGGWHAIGLTGGALVYLAVGTCGFRTKHPLLVVPFALILGVVAMLVLFSLAPGPWAACDS